MKTASTRDEVLAEEIRRKEFSNASTFGSSLNIDKRRSFDRNNNKGNRGPSKITKVSLEVVDFGVGTVVKQGISRETASP